MAEASTSNEVCCSTTCEDTPTVQVPGPNGIDGADGADGENAFTHLSASFTQPAVNANVTAEVDSSIWLSPGQIVFIETGGYYEVISKPSDTEVVLKNLGYTGNAAPAVVIPSGA